MIIRSDKIDKIIPLLAKVKSEIEGVTKKSENPYYSSSYADLNAHLDVVEPALEKHGLFVLQPTSQLDGKNVVNTIIYDTKSDQYYGCSLVVSDVEDAQKLGSAITYFRRYGLNSLLALKSLDDDGESTMNRKQKSKKKTRNLSAHEEF